MDGANTWPTIKIAFLNWWGEEVLESLHSR